MPVEVHLATNNWSGSAGGGWNVSEFLGHKTICSTGSVLYRRVAERSHPPFRCPISNVTELSPLANVGGRVLRLKG